MSGPTKAQRALMTPGICTRCGVEVKYPYERNSAGECMDCHNKGCVEYKAKRKLQLEEYRQKGIEYWADRGIKIGDTVQRQTIHMLFGLGFPVHGIAKTGACGAYVISNFQSGKLSPEGWHK